MSALSRWKYAFCATQPRGAFIRTYEFYCSIHVHNTAACLAVLIQRITLSVSSHTRQKQSHTSCHPADGNERQIFSFHGITMKAFIGEK